MIRQNHLTQISLQQTTVTVLTQLIDCCSVERKRDRLQREKNQKRQTNRQSSNDFSRDQQ